MKLIKLDEYKSLKEEIHTYNIMIPAMLDTPNLFSKEDIAKKCLELKDIEIRLKSLLG